MRTLNNRQYLLLSSLSGILLSIAWPPLPLGLVLLFAFVPLLVVNESLIQSGARKSGSRFFLYSYLTLIIWNVLTTWWIWNATSVGSLFAMAANALLMSIPMIGFHHTRKRLGILVGYLSLPIYWLAFEYIHLNWDLSWPWLTLGNAFASTPSLVQWYEFSGALGGSLWILMSNVLVLVLLLGLHKVYKKQLVVATVAWIVLPIALSVFMYVSYEDVGKPAEVVVVQPNIDPYEEKFSGSPRFIPYKEQLARMLALTDSLTTDKTHFVLWPETALPSGYDEEEILSYATIDKLMDKVAAFPNLSLITGMDSHVRYSEAATPTVRYVEGFGYYDSYNTAMHINGRGDNPEFYHKSKLVPGVETIPAFLGRFAIDLGGTMGSLGVQEERSVFFGATGKGAAPVICYESIFGDFVGDYVRNGAGFIAIITNDAWWGNTPGHKQHMQYASLRAIETRKGIARSANTGISGFINQRGDIVSASEYDVMAVMKGEVLVNDVVTFYTLYGDFIGQWAVYLSAMLVIYYYIKKFMGRKGKKVSSADFASPKVKI
ncbi:apolipoprotein N-acyltransferase [Cytophagaceae bacterium ABcell3]|nr:apolipoprotein N-acyltransferase [Cytophagaceae bacterium ABcell3]